MTAITRGTGPHAGRPILSAGAPLAEATSALILVHGRGSDAADMIALARRVAGPSTACLAPEAAGRSWYPFRFIEPRARNEPDLSSALSVLGALVDGLVDGGLPASRIALLGFSQGACLALELAFRRRERLGAVLGHSGGLIGDVVAAPAAAGSPLDGMPVLLACSERDPHIPLARVRETEAILSGLGAAVTARIHPGDGHTVTRSDLDLARTMLAALG